MEKTFSMVTICFILLMNDIGGQQIVPSVLGRDRADVFSNSNTILENPLPNCKALNIYAFQKRKQPKETNWKQKFHKPQNENICLTSVNTEMNGNFHFLSFETAFENEDNK